MSHSTLACEECRVLLGGYVLGSLEPDEADAVRAHLATCTACARQHAEFAVMPALLGHISFEDEEVKNARRQAVEPVLRLIEAAQAAGRLRADVAFGDIGLLLVRLSRPLPGPFPRELDMRLAHRHLELVLAALEAHPESRPSRLGGPVMTLAELQGL